MSDFKLPDLPSDKELGIEGLTEEDLLDDPPFSPEDPPAGAAPRDPPKDPPKPPKPPKGTAKRPDPATPAGRPAPPWRGVVTLLVLLVGAWASRPARTMPSPRAANAPDSVFASARALTQLVDITRAPHPPGSPEHARVRATLLERMADLGLTPQVQTEAYFWTQDDAATGATVRNLVARLPGTASTGAIVLTAHYDSRTFSHGAGDDGTGVVAILETLRALQTGPALRNDLIVLITDAEELGLIGARAFVDRHPWMADVRLVVSVEMRGAGGPSIMFETNADNGWVIERLAAADPHPLANSLSIDVYRRLPNDTDFTPFREAGVQGYNFAAIGRAHIYHQAYDTPANLDEATLQHHGARLLAMTRDLGAQDLTEVDAPDRAFVTLPVVGLLSWPLSWALALTGGLGLLLVLVGGITLARGGGWKGMLTGLGLGLLITGLVAGAGQGLLIWARGRHPEFGALQGSLFHVEGWYVLALAALALAATTVALSAVRARVHRGALAFGTMLPITILALVVGFVSPDVAPNLQGPAAAGLLAVLVVSLAGPKRDGGWVAWGLTLLLALPVMALLVLVFELVWVAMTFSLAAVLGATLVTMLLLMGPALDALNSPNRWWAPLTSLVACGLFVFLGARTATPSPERPAPSTLIYIQDQGGPGAPVRAFWASRADAGIDWARERSGTALDREESFDGLRLGTAPWMVADAPAITLTPPRAVLRQDTVVNGRRRLSLTIDPGLGAESVGFRVEAPARLVSLGGAALGDGAAPITRVWHHGSPADSVFLLTVEQDAAFATLDLEILQHHQRPWELVGADAFARPPELAPNSINLSDRAVVRSTLRLLLDGSGVAGGTLEVPGMPADSVVVVPADTLARPDTLAVPDTLTRPDTLRTDTLTRGEAGGAA